MVLEALFPPRGGGGAESQVLTLGRRLQDRGYRVTVVVPMVAHGPQAAREVVGGLDVIRIAYPKVRGLGGLVMLSKLAMLMVARRRDFDVIHAHIAHNMAAVSALVGAFLGKRVVVKITGLMEMAGGVLDPHAGPIARARRFALHRATLVQATSTRIRDLLVACGFRRERVVLLPNGVDTGRFQGGRRDAVLRERLCADARLVGIYVGRLVPEKGNELLVEAWAAALAAQPDVKLVLVGDGVLRPALEDLCRTRGISSQVVFAGHADRVAEFLAIADFALLTSFAEGLSNALLEYMAAGLPVIGSRVSGTEDFIAHGRNGWLFDAGDAAALAQCLAAAAAATPETLAAMGHRGREHIEATASLEAVTQRVVECYGFAPVPVPGSA
jgi:glycosyltransferase involved in cell wall biosynthesis